MGHILIQLNLISFGERYKIDVFCGQKLLNKQYTKSANHGTFINWTSLLDFTTHQKMPL